VTDNVNIDSKNFLGYSILMTDESKIDPPHKLIDEETINGVWPNKAHSQEAELSVKHIKNMRYILCDIRCEVCGETMSVGCCQQVRKTPLFEMLQEK